LLVLDHKLTSSKYLVDNYIKSSSLHLTWPPTPGLAFTAVPYIRTAYNKLYNHTVSDLEKKWDLAVQRKPREGETAEEIAANDARENEQELPIFEVEFAVEDIGVRNNNQDQGRNRNEVQGNGNGNQWQGQGGNNPPAADGAAPNAANAGGPNNDGWEFRQDVPTSLVISTVMGALFYPAVSSAVGELLKNTLPRKWVGRGVGMKVAGRGLLTEKWGRTLVGGALFVVLKDVVTLYCKWKKARDVGRMRILDYKGPRGGEAKKTAKGKS